MYVRMTMETAAPEKGYKYFVNLPSFVYLLVSVPTANTHVYFTRIGAFLSISTQGSHTLRRQTEMRRQMESNANGKRTKNMRNGQRFKVDTRQ